jgi:DNA repair protein RAD16
VLVYHNTNPKVKRMKRKDLESYDVIMISCMASLVKQRRRIFLTIPLDSGLESMYRKELKGWNRDDGIVKEDSKYPATLADPFNVIYHF